MIGGCSYGQAVLPFHIESPSQSSGLRARRQLPQRGSQGVVENAPAPWGTRGQGLQREKRRGGRKDGYALIRSPTSRGTTVVVP